MNVMTRRGSLDNIVTYEHVCDTTADLVNIPLTQATLGSTAIVLKGKSGSFEVYIAKSGGVWIPITVGMNSGSNSGEGGIDTSNDTVTGAAMLQGYTAHDKDGTQVIGEIITRTIKDLQKVDSTLVIPAGYYAEAIEYEEEELPVAQENDIIFIDYDGTIRYSYSKDEVLALTELPPNPEHQGLTAQGWNWGLEHLKRKITDENLQYLAIGQNYITDDGNTRLYLSIPENNTNLRLRIDLNGTAVIDWGDNSETTTLTASTFDTITDTTHIYNNKGMYIITLTITGSARIQGTGNTGADILSDPTRTYLEDYYYYYLSLLQKIEVGENIIIGQKGLRDCANLQTITVPLSFNTVMDQRIFEGCHSLKAFVMPPQIEELRTRAFYQTDSLKYLSIPEKSFTAVGNEVFIGCTSLQIKYSYLHLYNQTYQIGDSFLKIAVLILSFYIIVLSEQVHIALKIVNI